MKHLITIACVLSLTSGYTYSSTDKKNGFIVVFKDGSDITTLHSDNQIQNLHNNFSNTISTLNSRLNGFTTPNMLSGVNNPFQKSVNINSELWAINGIAGNFTITELLELVATGMVDGISRDYIRKLDVDFDDINTFADKSTYGLELIGINKLKDTMPNLDGTGVLVGVIDTGVDATHPELKGKIAGFKDFTANGKSQAYDDQGHGTHTSGTIAGGSASGTKIGVAPGAKILAAKVFDKSGFSKDSVILKSMQFMLDPDGNPNTSDQPALVNNSWGGKQKSEDFEGNAYQKIIAQWINAGIVPVFAAGNSGKNGSNTVGVPGSLPTVIAVGAVDQNKSVTAFSSRGPSFWKIADANGAITRKEFVKPDVAAPGAAIYSSIPGGKYKNANGTSMACPHVAGVVALLKQAKPNATITDIKQALESTTLDLGNAGKDNFYGFGLINAQAAVNKLLNKPATE